MTDEQKLDAYVFCVLLLMVTCFCSWAFLQLTKIQISIYRKKALSQLHNFLSIFDVLIIPKFPQIPIVVSKVTLMMFTLHTKGVDKIIVV